MREGRHLGETEDVWPFAEGEVWGDDHRVLLVKLADKMEGQLAAGLTEGQIAQLVEDDEVEPRQVIGDTALTTSRHLLPHGFAGALYRPRHQQAALLHDFHPADDFQRVGAGSRVGPQRAWGRLRHDLHPSAGKALDALREFAQRKQRRGYRVI